METTEAKKRIEQLKEEQKFLEKIIEDAKDKDKITSRVKSYEDACKILNIDSKDDLPYPNPTNSKQKGLNEISKIITIVQALNEGWEPDWANYNEYKYYPWFEYSSSGFGFSATYCDNASTAAAVGSRLVFKTRALAEYAGKNFENIYNEWLLNEKK